MSTRVIFYSDRADDPTEMAEVLEAADDYAANARLPFAGVVNQALRNLLGLPEVELDILRGKEPEEEEAAEETVDREGGS